MKGRSLLRATLRYWLGSKVSLSKEMFAGLLGAEAELGKPWRGMRSLQAVRGAPRWNPNVLERRNVVRILKQKVKDGVGKGDSPKARHGKVAFSV